MSLENNSIPVDDISPTQGTAEGFSKASKAQEKKLTTEEYQNWLFENIQKLPTREFNKLDQEIFDRLSPEQKESMLLEGENKVALREIESREKELKTLERIEVAEKNIAALELSIAGRRKNLATIELQKMNWNLFTSNNKGLETMARAEQYMITECERAITANKLYKYDEKYAPEITVKREKYNEIIEEANALMRTAEQQGENRAEIAKVVHSIAKDVAKGIIAVESGGNPGAIGATSAAFDSIIGLGELASGDTTEGQVILDVAESFLSDSLGGAFGKIPQVKNLTKKIGSKIGETAAQMIVQKLGASIVKGGVKTGSNVIEFSDAWREVETVLPPNITPENKEQVKNMLQEEMDAGLAGFAKTAGIEFIKSAIPGGKTAAGVVIGGASKGISKELF